MEEAERHDPLVVPTRQQVVVEPGEISHRYRQASHCPADRLGNHVEVRVNVLTQAYGRPIAVHGPRALRPRVPQRRSQIGTRPPVSAIRPQSSRDERPLLNPPTKHQEGQQALDRPPDVHRLPVGTRQPPPAENLDRVGHATASARSPMTAAVSLDGATPSSRRSIRASSR
jgi:hypothetical protein